MQERRKYLGRAYILCVSDSDVSLHHAKGPQAKLAGLSFVLWRGLIFSKNREFPKERRSQLDLLVQLALLQPASQSQLSLC